MKEPRMASVESAERTLIVRLANLVWPVKNVTNAAAMMIVKEVKLV